MPTNTRRGAQIAETETRALRAGSSALLALLVAACGSYAPPKVDEKTGLYPAIAALDAGAVQKRDTSIDLGRYRFVYLSSDTNVYPGRFEFFARAALAEAGFKHVLNTQELTSFVSSRQQLSTITSIGDPLSQRRISELVGPALRIDVVSRWDGEVRRYVTLTATDMSSGTVLLQVSQPRLIWVDVDSEAHYPVFNEFKRWVEACKRSPSATKS
jgi:hypothetical protein